jgi:hypothetical protein
MRLFDIMHLYKRKRFVVTIDRSTVERGYVLKTIEKDGSMKAQNEPLKRHDFESHFGFDASWPHDDILSNNSDNLIL